MNGKHQGRRGTGKFELPDAFQSSYTEQDRDDVATIIAWLNRDDNLTTRTQTTLARHAGCNQSTVQAILKGKYKSPPHKWITQLKRAIERIDNREEAEVNGRPYVHTRVSQAVEAACKRAHLYRMFAVISTYVGLGKTTALKHYRDQHPTTTLLIEADPDMNAGVLLDELVRMTNAVVHKATRHSRGTKAERMVGVIRALEGTDKLLILDEAETVTASCLEYIRRISDKAEVGVVLAGSDKLYPLVRDPRGRFGQVSSRVGFWPDVIEHIEPEDCRALAEAALREYDIEFTDELHDAFWQVCLGSARVLCGRGQLIDGLRDYVINKGKPVTPDAVFRIGNKLLGYSPTA